MLITIIAQSRAFSKKNIVKVKYKIENITITLQIKLNVEKDRNIC